MGKLGASEVAGYELGLTLRGRLGSLCSDLGQCETAETANPRCEVFSDRCDKRARTVAAADAARQ